MAYELEQDEVEMLQAAAEEADVDCELRLEYSGRGMYGRTCVGLVHDSQREVFRFLFALRESLPDLVDEMIDDVRTDSMGLSTITYWPYVRVAQEEVDADD